MGNAITWVLVPVKMYSMPKLNPPIFRTPMVFSLFSQCWCLGRFWALATMVLIWQNVSGNLFWLHTYQVSLNVTCIPFFYRSELQKFHMHHPAVFLLTPSVDFFFFLWQFPAPQNTSRLLCEPGHTKICPDSQRKVRATFVTKGVLTRFIVDIEIKSQSTASARLSAHVPLITDML